MGDRMTQRSTEHARITASGHRPRLLGSRNWRLPDFIVIGAMKAGTTSLFEYLRAHPQVFMSPLKEMDFFVEERNWPRGMDWYGRRFRRAGSDVVAVGEASPSYTKYPEHTGVPERIAAYLPDVKLIYLVRDPIERIRSHYQHRVMVGSEHAPIESAVLRDPTYVDVTRYAVQIERYLNWFPRESILVLTAEELRTQRLATMHRVHRFLQIDPDFVAPTIDREFYRTDERASSPFGLWWVRRNLKGFVPRSTRWWLRRSMNRYIPADQQVQLSTDPGAARWVGGREHTTASRLALVRVPKALRAQLIEALRDDVARLRSYMPEGFDGWGIA